MRDLQASVEPARKGRTRGLERGLCHSVVLLLEDERDDFADLGILVMKVCLEAHNRKSYWRPTTKEGLYWMRPSGPPATTSISVDCTGRAARRPSKAETAKSLENIACVSKMWSCRAEKRSRGPREIERKGYRMSYQWAFRGSLYPREIIPSALRSWDCRE